MEALAKRIFTRERMTVATMEAVEDAAVDALIEGIPTGGTVPEPFAAFAPLPHGCEGVSIPAQVGFAVMGSNLYRHGKRYAGSFPVLANILNYVYLWGEIRVQGGAYGCGFVARDHGDLMFYTYRDPQPARSIGVMKRTADFIRAFCSEQPDLTGYILSAVSAIDPLRNASAKMAAATVFYFRGITRQMIVNRYRQLIGTTSEDLLKLCDAVEDIAADETVCVVAGKDQLDACADTIQTIINV